MAMTSDEHLLILMMFSRYSQYITMVEDILKSKGVVIAEDLPAFEFAVVTDPLAGTLSFQNTIAQYLKFAEELKLEIPIPSRDFKVTE